MTLPKRQRELVDFIRGYLGQNGWAPTVLEMALALGVANKTVLEMLKALERKGAIVRAYKQSRAIRIVEGTGEMQVVGKTHG